MNVNELRIGNWIKEPVELGASVIQVKTIDTDKDGYCHYLDHCSPIQLTEDWLFKFRFEKKVRNPKCTQYECDYSDASEFYENGIIFSFSLGAPGCRVDIKYVHQLQNIYFALTGEELTIK